MQRGSTGLFPPIGYPSTVRRPHWSFVVMIPGKSVVMRYTSRILAVFMVGVLLASCARWSTRTEKRTQKLTVKTEPAGAKVWVEGKSGKKAAGESPVEISFDYDVEYQEFDSRWWWFPGAWAAAGLAGVGMFSEALAYKSDPDGTTLIHNSRTGSFIVGCTMASVGVTIAVISSIVFGVYETSEGERSLGSRYTIGANLDGHGSAERMVETPFEISRLDLMLAGEKPPSGALGGAEISTKNGPGPRRSIVAVFSVHDSAGLLKKNEIAQLTTYLGTALTTTGLFKIIPQDQIKARLLDGKLGSYKDCVDETCQIELGKTLSAQKSLATQLIKVGKKCAVTASLYDLRTETAEKGAMVNTGCSSDELLEAMQQVAKQLAGG